MEVRISARHGSISDAFRRHTEERLRRLERFETRPARADVILEKERGARKVEAHVTVHGGGQFIAHGSAPSYRVALDLTFERLARQLKRSRQLYREHHVPKNGP